MPFDHRLPVLVVEDEDITAGVVAALLCGMGFEHVDWMKLSGSEDLVLVDPDSAVENKTKT